MFHKKLKTSQTSIPIDSFSSFFSSPVKYTEHGSKNPTLTTSVKNSNTLEIQSESKKDFFSLVVTTNSISWISHDIRVVHILSGMKHPSTINNLSIMKAVIKNILIITAILTITQGVFVAFFLLV